MHSSIFTMSNLIPQKTYKDNTADSVLFGMIDVCHDIIWKDWGMNLGFVKIKNLLDSNNKAPSQQLFMS